MDLSIGLWSRLVAPMVLAWALILNSQGLLAQDEGALGTLENDATKPISLVTIPWEPYYGPDLEEQGFFSALVRAAFAEVQRDIDIEFVPWQRALRMVETAQRDLALGAYFTEERAETFYYSDPIYYVEIGLIARADVDLASFQSMDDLRSYRIGVTRGFANSPTFDAADFLDKDFVSRPVQNIHKLYRSRIELMVMPFDRFRFELAKLEGFALDEVVFVQPPLQRSGLYLIISKSHPQGEAIVETFNRGLASLVQSGGYTAILQDFGFDSAGSLVAER
ncbi:MAG: substrate-binding periplasmic protein [Candidatus Competibacterales bacterium]